MITEQKLQQTDSLEETIFELYGINIERRTSLFEKEEMSGEVAKQYFQLGRDSRSLTYQRIVQDFKARTGCYACNHPNYQMGEILDVGCGPGLLNIELAEHTGARIIGLDPSSDMLDLAREYLMERSNQKEQRIKDFQQKYGIETKDRSSLYSVEFVQGDVYNLSKIVQPVDYIVCRNVLHRCRDVKKAIKEMYKVLLPGGKIYLRDLRRDAEWKVIVERIGKRWKNPGLVEDYLKAMAGMLTTDEVVEILGSLRIRDYTITNGGYLTDNKVEDPNNLKEFASEVEWVSVIEKSSKL
ncbi:MAG: methyltransferase domain-containing protein [Candidatus Woesearchaeota archaeon]|jgi:ubiquinone/menaquinone biosynthesis C-methylase UbiE